MLIQQMLREQFQDSLVLVIAHRLSTVVEYDRIVVLDDGRIVESGHAHVLLSNPSGLFRRMVDDAGEEAARQLEDMAQRSWEKMAASGPGLSPSLP